ncbi:hypothetical protein K0B96_15605 [Horticoccus luteus]|uniref:Uncharacterized protein n=1 Tax=Horticoccus luteus TaxID=2862869 RepID=A0A8F9TW83_9BACT|nr:hypothetical protein [Horticoccus luteus]QYM78707.1 hypothetical protein K0B96_15605 [Horticoccus luteus]
MLLDAAREFVDASHAPALVACWDAFDEALIWQPPVALFTVAFSWQRTLERP